MKCNYCGADLDDDALFCTSCGKVVEKKEVCPHCGAELEEDALFCNECGAKVEKKEQVEEPKVEGTICPHCGATNEEDSTFCTSCGKPIKAVEPKASPTNMQTVVASTPTKSNQNKTIKVIQLIVGSALIMIGLVKLRALSIVEFGGDFYTYVYAGIYQIQSTFSWILVGIGAIIDFDALKDWN